MTEQQPAPQHTQGSVERDVANLVAVVSNTTIIVAVVIFGLLLDFIAELISVGSSPGSNVLSASEVLMAIGNFCIVVVLFAGGLMKRDAGEWSRFGMLLAAAIVFFASFHLY